MLSSRAVENHAAAPSFKTPGTKRRAFGDISNRKLPVHNNTKPTVQKPTVLVQTNTSKPVVKHETKVSFDDDDDSIEMPAGRLGKDLGTEEWLMGDIFGDVERADQEFDDAIRLGQEKAKQAEIERDEAFKMELEMECRKDGIADAVFLRKEFEKYCSVKAFDDSSFESDSCDELEWPEVDF